jgi:ABC-2 type transport system ATP-binding protein
MTSSPELTRRSSAAVALCRPGSVRFRPVPPQDGGWITLKMVPPGRGKGFDGPMLELITLRKRFGEVVALDGLSLRAGPGRIHGFVGRNGAGKTTTMRIALGLLEPDAGEVLIDGRPVTVADRRRIGYLPEERGLYPKMSPRDQVIFFGELSGVPARRAAAEADRLLDTLGIGARATEPVEKLSLGNQQRVQLAVALVPSPDLLVLDEPFSGLDPVGVDALAEVLRSEVERGVGVVFSSHQLELVERLCDEVTIIDAGRVVAAGSIAELRAGDGRVRLRVGLSGGWTNWAEGVEGARVVSVGADDVLLELEPGGDDQRVLAAAQAAGRVRTFVHEQPSLVELFREVVTVGAGAKGEGR